MQRAADLVVERVDLVPQGFKVEDLARQREGADDVGRGRARFGGQEVDEGGAGAVDHRVGDEGGNDFALERVGAMAAPNFSVSTLGK